MRGDVPQGLPSGGAAPPVKRRARPLVRLEWESPPLQFSVIKRRGRALILARSPDAKGYALLALEGPAKALGSNDPSVLFDNHAHHAIGVFATLRESERAALAYARAWLRKSATAARCACGPISTEAK